LKSYLAGVIELFGTAAAASMVLFYALEERGPRFTLAFSVSCLAAAGYALAIGSWPFFAVEAVWACVAARRGLRRLAASR
jgi:hypothetical protein